MIDICPIFDFKFNWLILLFSVSFLLLEQFLLGRRKSPVDNYEKFLTGSNPKKKKKTY